MAAALIAAAAVAASAPALAAYGPMQVRLALGLLTVAVVYFAAKSGAPRAPVLRQTFGLLLALIAVWIGWVAYAAVDPSAALGDVAASVAREPQAWIDALAALSEERSFRVGGRDVQGGMLLWTWGVLAGLLVVAGLLGGHHAGGGAAPRTFRGRA